MPPSADSRESNALKYEGRVLQSDWTLVEAWVSLKSFKRKDAGPTEPPDRANTIRAARPR